MYMLLVDVSDKSQKKMNVVGIQLIDKDDFGDV